MAGNLIFFGEFLEEMKVNPKQKRKSVPLYSHFVMPVHF